MMDSSDCARRLRRLEFEAYANIVNVFRAHGELTEPKLRVLNELKQILKVSPERHIAEVKRVLNDESLSTIALELYKVQLVGEKWLAEARSPFMGDRLRKRDAGKSENAVLKPRRIDSNVHLVKATDRKHQSEVLPSNSNEDQKDGGEQRPLESAQKCHVETQTDFEQELEKRVAAVIAQIVEGKREIGPSSSANDQFLQMNGRERRKTAGRRKANAFTSDFINSGATSAAKLEVVKRRGRLPLRKNALKKRKEAKLQASVDGRKRGRRVSRIANAGGEKARRVSRLHASRESVSASVPSETSASASATRSAQPTRLQVLDSSQAPRSTPSTSVSSAEPSAPLVQDIEVTEARPVSPMHVEARVEEPAVARVRSDSESSSLNLNDTNFFIQHTMLSVEKHDLVTSAGGSHILVDPRGTFPCAPELPQAEASVKRGRRTLAGSQIARKTAKRSPQRHSSGDVDSAATRPAKRPKRETDNSSEPKRRGRRKKQPVLDTEAQVSADKAAAFKVRLPAHRKSSSGSANGTPSSRSPALTCNALNANILNNNDPGASVALSRVLPTFACVTGTGYNYSSLARHSTTPPNVASRFSLASLDCQTPSYNGAVMCNVDSNLFPAEAVPSIAAESEVEVATTDCCDELGDVAENSLVTDSSALQAPLAVASPVAVLSQVRAAVRPRNVIGAVRPATVSRIVCVERPQVPMKSANVTTVSAADYQRMLTPKHISIATPRGLQPLVRGTPPTAVSVIVQTGSAPAPLRPPIVTRRLPSHSIVSVIKPVLSNSTSQGK